MTHFIELHLVPDQKRILVNIEWIKTVFPLDDTTNVIVGDGYNDSNVNPEIVEVSETYDQIKDMVRAAGAIQQPNPSKGK